MEDVVDICALCLYGGGLCGDVALVARARRGGRVGLGRVFGENLSASLGTLLVFAYVDALSGRTVGGVAVAVRGGFPEADTSGAGPVGDAGRRLVVFSDSHLFLARVCREVCEVDIGTGVSTGMGGCGAARCVVLLSAES